MKKGFTLAEVLITLTVVGVIAAFVIPAINQSVRNAGTVEGVRKYQRILNEAVTNYMRDNGCIGDLSKCNAFAGDYKHANVWNAIKPYFKVIKDCGTATGQGCFPIGVTYKALNGTSDMILDDRPEAKAILIDGASLYLVDLYENCNADYSRNGIPPLLYTCANIAIDINGAKEPNQWGRDIFYWYITKRGVYPFGMYFAWYYSDINGEPACDPTDVTTGNPYYSGLGYGCTAKILKEGR